MLDDVWLPGKSGSGGKETQNHGRLALGQNFCRVMSILESKTRKARACWRSSTEVFVQGSTRVFFEPSGKSTFLEKADGWLLGSVAHRTPDLQRKQKNDDD